MRNKLPDLTGHIRKKFIAGLLLCFPILITFFVLKFLFGFIDPLLKPLLGFIPWISDHTTGISAIITLLLIYLIGLISGHVLGKRMIKFFLQSLPQRVPFVNKIYSLAKSLIDAIVPGDTQKTIGRVVIVRLNPLDPKPKMLGLLMSVVRIIEKNNSGTVVSDENHGVVFFSSSPFPQSGQLVLFPLNKIFNVKVPVKNNENIDDLWFTKEEFIEFLKHEEYIGIIGSIATIIPKTFVLQPINIEKFESAKPASKN